MNRQRPDSVGFDYKLFQIEEIDAEGFAHGVDQFGKQMTVTTTLVRGKGVRPAVGDQWVIDRSISGRWSFASIVNTVPPEVTGSRASGAALANLLEVLEGMGLIQDKTTP